MLEHKEVYLPPTRQVATVTVDIQKRTTDAETQRGISASILDPKLRKYSAKLGKLVAMPLKLQLTETLGDLSIIPATIIEL